MARTVKELPPRKTRYPWQEWTNGKVWAASQGKDFDCDTVSFQAAVRTHAYRHKLKATTRIQGDTVVFQFEKTARKPS